MVDLNAFAELDSFAHVISHDFEFLPDANGISRVVCGVFKDLRTGKLHRLWEGDFGPSPPFPVDDSALWLAFKADAEMQCFLALGWPLPVNVIDLYAEFRNQTNGEIEPKHKGAVSLLGALRYYDLEGIGADENEYWIKHILAGASDVEGVLAYCQSDVDETGELFLTMFGKLNIPEALLRGRYSGSAVAHIQQAGIPIDTETLGGLQRHGTKIRPLLVAEMDKAYGFYPKAKFSNALFSQYLADRNIDWPRTPKTLQPDTSESVRRTKIIQHPELREWHVLATTLPQLKFDKLQVGRDGRARSLCSQFGTATGRNAPGAQFIYTLPRWVRRLIKPASGHGICYLDYRAQEFGIAAAASRDTVMMADYASGDPYLRWAEHGGAVPLAARLTEAL